MKNYLLISLQKIVRGCLPITVGYAYKCVIDIPLSSQHCYGIELHLCADELIQQVELGETVIIVGVPVFDSSRKLVTLEACHFTMANTATCFSDSTSRIDFKLLIHVRQSEQLKINP